MCTHSLKIFMLSTFNIDVLIGAYLCDHFFNMKFTKTSRYDGLPYLGKNIKLIKHDSNNPEDWEITLADAETLKTKILQDTSLVKLLSSKRKKLVERKGKANKLAVYNNKVLTICGKITAQRIVTTKKGNKIFTYCIQTPRRLHTLETVADHMWFSSIKELMLNRGVVVKGMIGTYTKFVKNTEGIKTDTTMEDYGFSNIWSVRYMTHKDVETMRNVLNTITEQRNVT